MYKYNLNFGRIYPSLWSNRNGMEHTACIFNKSIITKDFTKTINSNGEYRELESVAGIFVARIGWLITQRESGRRSKTNDLFRRSFQKSYFSELLSILSRPVSPRYVKLV